MVDLRWLRIAAAVEAISLLLLIVNLMTAHLPTVTSVIGPIHGGAWLATIAIAFLIPIPLVPRWTSVVPGIGGLIALRLTSRPHQDERRPHIVGQVLRVRHRRGGCAVSRCGSRR